MFHYIVEKGLTYLCLADEKNKRRIPFLYLDDIKAKFQSSYGDRANTAIAFAMNQEFSRVMEERIGFFNDNPEADKFSKVKGQLEDVKGVMFDNIEKVRAAAAPHRPPGFPRGSGPSCQGAAPTHPPAPPPPPHPYFAPQVLARGEKIELLVDKTEALNQSAKKFQKASKSLKSAMWWKNVKMWLMIAFVLAIVAFLIWGFACGFKSPCQGRG